MHKKQRPASAGRVETFANAVDYATAFGFVYSATRSSEGVVMEGLRTNITMRVTTAAAAMAMVTYSIGVMILSFIFNL
jgi:hypothetical protein